GSIPFITYGNQYITQGAYYDYATLLDSSQNALPWQDIAHALGDPTSPIARGIIGTANYMTAAICNLTNQQPGSVCNVPLIQQIEQTIGKPSGALNTSALAIAPADVPSRQRRALV